jgi:hypothetical protein
MFAGYSTTFGPSLQLPPGIRFGPGAGGTLTVNAVARPEQGRYRMADSGEHEFTVLRLPI